MSEKHTKIIEFVFIDDPHGMDLDNTNSVIEEIKNTFISNWQMPIIEKIRMLMSKEEAIDFTKKYLKNRRKDTTIPVKLLVALELYKKDAVAVQEVIERAWDIAVEYTILDIIPYMYGEALD